MVAIVLASGMSKRMGENKLLLKFNGMPLLEYTLKVIESIPFKEKILVYKDEEVKSLGDRYGFKCIKNDEFYKGQSSSLKLGVKSIKSNAYGIMFFSSDEPFLKKEDLLFMIEKFNEGSKIIVPKVNGEKKMPTIFHIKYKNELLNVLGDVGGRNIIKENLKDVTFVEFNNSKNFFDIDTKEDFKEGLKLL